MESLSAYARQFLEMMDKPDVDLIEGLSPAIRRHKTEDHLQESSIYGGHGHRDLRLSSPAVPRESHPPLLGVQQDHPIDDHTANGRHCYGIARGIEDSPPTRPL